MSKTITVSDETFESIKDQLETKKTKPIEDLTDLIGMKLFIRTVTYHLTGHVVAKIGGFLQLEEAAWIADSGRFQQALQTGNFSEVEPVGTAFVNLNSVTDFFPLDCPLPKKQK